MKNNRLLIALVVLIGVGSLAVMASRSHQSETTLSVPTNDVPKLKKEELTSVEIIRPGQETVMLTKQDKGWQLTQPVVGSVDTTTVDGVLDKLSDLGITGVAATRKENHSKLQVDDAKAIRVKAKTSDKLALDLLVGASKGGVTMLRLAGQDTVFTGSIGLRYAVDKETKMFRDRVITDFDTAELTTLSVQSSKGTFKFEKSGESWKQAAGEKPIPEFSNAKVSSLASTLARLRAADFAAPTFTAEAAGLAPGATPAARVVFTLKSAPPVTLDLGNLHENGSEHYARVSGKETLFRVSKFTGERMTPDSAAFAADKKDAKAETEGQGEGEELGALGEEGNGILNDTLKQVRQQIATQGDHP